MKEISITDLRLQLQDADRATFEVLEAGLKADPRKGVQSALARARKRIEAAEAEAQRLDALYAFERDLAQEALGGAADEQKAVTVLGLDEVGRGPLAGPLTIGGVVLGDGPHLEGLNDSKQVSAAKRTEVAAAIRKSARAYTVVHVQPEEIDRTGMSAALRTAFGRAIRDIESQGVHPDVILLDGNPLHLDEREVSVVKGDGKCASIAAASILAKVTRDGLMEGYDADYPQYGFAHNKGYGSADHIEAIKAYGLTPLHRASFCTSFTQPTLF